MSNFLNLLLHNLNIGSYLDTPPFPRSRGRFDQSNSLFQFQKESRQAKILKEYDPSLYDELMFDVVQSANEIKEKEKELNSLRTEASELEKKLGGINAKLANLPSTNHNPDDDITPRTIPKKPSPKSWEILLTIGLSLFLIVGISQILGVYIQDFTLDQLPTALLAVAAAISINIAEYLGIYRGVKVARRTKSQNQ